MTFTQNDIWVLGQTSPSGIQIRGGQNADHEGLVDVEGDRHIWQHVRIRPDAPFSANNCCHGPFIFKQVNGGVIDHCSLSWGDDDCLDIFRSDNVTASNNLIAEGLNTASKSARGSIASQGTGITITKNLYAHHSLRAPMMQDINVGDVFNNVSYNVTRDHEYQSVNGSQTNYNVECNVEIKGVNSSGFWQDFVAFNSDGNLTIYENDNKVLQSFGTNCATAPEPFWLDAASGATQVPAPSGWFTNQPFDCPRQLKLPVCEVVDYVLDNAGASHNRDAFDAGIISDVLNGGGSVISSPGPWPSMSGGAAKNIWDDTKPDQLSDAIKTECGLDPATHQNTVNTNTNGGIRNDFLYIMDYCFGL